MRWFHSFPLGIRDEWDAGLLAPPLDEICSVGVVIWSDKVLFSRRKNQSSTRFG